MIGKRLKEVRSILNLSQREIFKNLGLKNQQTYGNYETETSEIPNKVLEIFAEQYDVNLNWLLTGKGEMFSGTTESSDCLSIPILPMRASAGYGKETFEIKPIGIFQIDRTLLANYSGKFYNIQIVGDSMSDTLEDGDWVTVAKQFVSGNGIYLLNCMGELFVKRVNFKIGGEIEVISDNPKYPTEKLKREETIIVGKCLLGLVKL